MNTYPLFVARRYLFSREGGPLVMIITAISVLGVAIGVAALVAVISVMDGADEDLFRKMIDIYAHVKVQDITGVGFSNYEELVEAMESVPGVKGASPAISRNVGVFWQFGEMSDIEGIRLEGIDPEREARVTGISDPKHIVDGTGIPGEQEIVLGVELARRLRTYVGDSITVFTKFARTTTGPGAIVPKQERLKVVGVLRSGYYDFDRMAAYVSLQTAQRLFVLDDVAEDIRASLAEPFKVDQIRPLIAEKVSPLILEDSARLIGWDDENKGFFNALQLEKIALFVILLLVVIVASFNIIGTQILIVMQKTREIGILMSMGVSRRAVRYIFLGFGLIIGLLGTLLGVALGLAICLLIAKTDVIQLPPDVYMISRLPVKVKPLTVTIIVACSLAICSIAAVFPAWRASRLDPVEALRYE